MKIKFSNRKILAIALLFLAVSSIHFLTPIGNHQLHLIHVIARKLFLLPIALASVWFGLLGGFCASLLAALIYLFHISIDWKGQMAENFNQISEIITFLVVGIGTGAFINLENRLRKEKQKERKRAETDPLTTLFNRNYLKAHFASELQRVRTNQYPLSVCLIDIDDFKKINDRLGHPAGDEVLIYLSSILKDLKRESDIAIRYGGDEFLVILPGAKTSEALKWGERLLQRLAETPFSLGNSSNPLSLSVSIGCSQYHPESDDEEDLIRRADKELYKEKRRCSSSGSEDLVESVGT